MKQEKSDPFLDWLKGSPNNFSFWAPKLSPLAGTAVYVPKTLIKQIPDKIIPCFFLEKDTDRSAILDWVTKDVMPRVREVFPTDRALFIKNGCFSGKFDFRRSCLLEEITPEAMAEHFLRIQYDSLCLDTCGNAEIIIREWMEPETDLGTIYNGMPLRPELRVFYDFDRKGLLYTANYWDWNYCHEAICRHEADKAAYEKAYDIMEYWLKRYSDRWLGLIDSALKLVPLRGRWSVDFILEEKRPILIDMAIAEQSAYWDEKKAEIA